MKHQPERLEGVPREYLYSNQLCKDIFEAFCLLFYYHNVIFQYLPQHFS